MDELELKNPTPNTDDWKTEKGVHKISVIFLAIITFFSLSYLLFFLVNSTEQFSKYKTFSPHKNSEPSDWKTYRNEEYGFEFKYPQDWKHKSLNADISYQVFNPPDPNCECDQPPSVTTSYAKSFEEFNLNSGVIAKDIKSYVEIQSLVGSSFSINYNGVNWSCYEMEGPGVVNNCISQNSNGNIVSMFLSLNDEWINKILSTFVFINKPLNASDYLKPFQKGEFDYYGTLTLKGYLVIKETEAIDGSIYKYASFYFTSTNNNKIIDYLKESKNNYYNNENSIGLGCYDSVKGIIESQNIGDFDLVINKISGDDLKYLLSGSKSNPIELQVTKSYVSAGGGAPSCYSLFRNFKIIK